MLSKGTYARKDPILLKDVIEVFVFMIVLKDLPPGVFSLGNVLTTFP